MEALIPYYSSTGVHTMNGGKIKKRGYPLFFLFCLFALFGGQHHLLRRQPLLCFMRMRLSGLAQARASFCHFYC